MKNLHDVTIEQMFIGCLFTAQSLFHEVAFLKADDFYDDVNSSIWYFSSKALLDGKKLTPAFVAMDMYSDVGDRSKIVDYISNCIGSVVLSSELHEYARIIRDLSDRRKIYAHTQEIAELAQNTSCGMNADEIRGKAVVDFMAKADGSTGIESAYKVGRRVIENLTKEVAVTSSGFRRLDYALGGGFFRGRYYGFAARMKCGKSLFLGTLAYNMSFLGNARILYLCLEMGSEESLERLLSMRMGCNALDFRKPIRFQPEFQRRAIEANEFMADKSLMFKSHPRMTLDELKSVIARAGMSGKFDGIILDYLQLVEGKSPKQSTAEHYDNVSQTLAEAVKRYPMWIISAAQLNKEGGVRGSDGLLMACDLAMSINKVEGQVYTTPDGDRKDPDRSYLEGIVSRYTPNHDVGNKDAPAYETDLKCGPMFVEYPY